MQMHISHTRACTHVCTPRIAEAGSTGNRPRQEVCTFERAARNTRACTHARTHACTHARTHARTHAYTHIHGRGRGHAHTCACVRRTHTHTHLSPVRPRTYSNADPRMWPCCSRDSKSTRSVMSDASMSECVAPCGAIRVPLNTPWYQLNTPSLVVEHGVESSPCVFPLVGDFEARRLFGNHSVRCAVHSSV